VRGGVREWRREREERGPQALNDATGELLAVKLVALDPAERAAAAEALRRVIAVRHPNLVRCLSLSLSFSLSLSLSPSLSRFLSFLPQTLHTPCDTAASRRSGTGSRSGGKNWELYNMT
jgi:hypothetical protein